MLALAAAWRLARGDVVVSIHYGSRGLGRQIGTDFLRETAIAAPGFDIVITDSDDRYRLRRTLKRGIAGSSGHEG
jgi:RNA-splicing ligase RtcB